jgi:hypothetical protein
MKSINDLLENNTQYESNFKKAWGNSSELSDVFEKTIDFHERYILKSLEKRNVQIVRFAKALSKKEQKKIGAGNWKKTKRILKNLSTITGRSSKETYSNF